MPPRSQTQTQIPLGDAARKQQPSDDYVNLFPPGVYPTPMRVLEQGDSLLCFVHRESNQLVSRKQEQLFRLMVRFGSWHTDTPGSVTIVVVRGNKHTRREVTIYDDFGVHGPVAWSNEEYTRWRDEWFKNHALR